MVLLKPQKKNGNTKTTSFWENNLHRVSQDFWPGLFGSECTILRKYCRAVRQSGNFSRPKMIEGPHFSIRFRLTDILL